MPTPCGGALQARTKEPRALGSIHYAAAAATLPSVAAHLAIRPYPDARPEGEIPRVNLPVRGRQGQGRDSDTGEGRTVAPENKASRARRKLTYQSHTFTLP